MVDDTGYNLQVPYAGRKRADNAEEAVDFIAALYEEKQRQASEIDNQIADAIGVALSRNVSLRQIARRLGVSPETVRKMRAAK